MEGINAVKPSYLIEQSVCLSGDLVYITGLDGEVETYDLSQFENIVLIGAGKASAAMAIGMEEIFGDRISSGVIVTKYGFGEKLKRTKLIEAGHPIPDENGQKAAKYLIDLCKNAGAKDLVIGLFSGGASALLPCPADGITLGEKMEVTRQLLNSGASIDELNIIRKHLSKIKGGGLLDYIYPAKVVSLIISDVIGDHLPTIGSGITFPETKSFEACWRIVEKYNLETGFPKAVLQYFQNKIKTEKAAKSPSRKVANKVSNIIIANNLKALLKIKKEAEAMAYETRIVDPALSGEAREIGAKIARDAILFANNEATPNKKYCLLYGGETTVTVKGDGKGGRNQELALAAALQLDNTKGITLLSAGTDGNDGPTDAAGAFCDGDTVNRGRVLGLDAKDYLERNDSYFYFKPIKGLVMTGPTGTNVMDVVIITIESRL